VLQAMMDAQLAGDPSRIPAGLPPAATALAYINTGFGRQQAADIMGQLAQQRTAAVPAIAQGMAAPDQAKWAAQYAQSPGANQYALSRVLQGLSPSGVAQMRLQAAEAEHQRAAAMLERAQAPWYQKRSNLPILGGGQLPTVGAGGGSTGGGLLRNPDNSMVNPYYSGKGGVGGGAGPASGTDQTPNFDAMTDAQLAQYARGKLSPQQRLVLARYAAAHRAVAAPPAVTPSAPTG
jgi:hypothetical protein